MQRLEVSGAVRPIYGSSGVKRLTSAPSLVHAQTSEVFQNAVRLPPSVAICLRLSDRRHGVLNHHRIVSVHSERIVIGSCSVRKVPFESNWFSRIAS